MTDFIVTYGLGALFVAVALESTGVPIPGEASLIAASALASQGYVDIGRVIVVAAIAAIVGDNVGYWAGRWGGRRLLGSSALIRRYAERALPKVEQLFGLHGPWWHFLLWNAAGGVVWATVVDLAGYLLGHAGLAVVSRYHWLATAAVLPAVAAAGAIAWWRRQRS